MQNGLNLLLKVIVISGCALGAGCSEDNATCPPCPAGMSCDDSTGTCVGGGDAQVNVNVCLQLCGLNTTCTTAQDCRCKGGWSDCNSDIGQSGGNGCECSQQCVGTKCGTGTKECEDTVYNSCGDKNLYCKGTECTRCEDNTYNCDGVGTCEESAPCASSGCEIFGSKTCGSQSEYCIEETGKCEKCQDGTYNCSSNGGDCECKNGCTGSACLDICQFDEGCDAEHFCDVGDCISCPTGTKNCDGKGWCECTGTCNGTQCIGDRACDYYDDKVCGGDSTRWCYENVCKLCSEDSPGEYFNCNGTMGCECDSQGCDGTACKGKCSGGECP